MTAEGFHQVSNLLLATRSSILTVITHSDALRSSREISVQVWNLKGETPCLKEPPLSKSLRCPQHHCLTYSICMHFDILP